MTKPKTYTHVSLLITACTVLLSAELPEVGDFGREGSYLTDLTDATEMTEILGPDTQEYSSTKPLSLVSSHYHSIAASNNESNANTFFSQRFFLLFWIRFFRRLGLSR